MEALQYSNEEIDNQNQNRNKEHTELHELKNILFELKSRRNELFKSLDNQTRKLCDRLIEYSLEFKSDDRVIELVNEIFDDRQIYIPGSVGSFVVNCVFNQKRETSKSFEEEKYSQYNFLFYHKIGSKELFAPLRVEKDNQKLIILLRNEDKDKFNLEQNIEKLKVFGVKSLDQVKIMIYDDNLNIGFNVNRGIKKSKEHPKKEKSIALSILLVAVLIAVVFVIYLVSK